MLWGVQGFDLALSWYAPTRAAADGTVTVRGPGGAVVTTGVAAREAVDTTLASGVGAGARELVLSAAQTLRSRGLYRLGGDRPEVVQVRVSDGVNVVLERPTRYGHEALADFESTLLTYTLPGASVTPTGDNWRAYFAITGYPAHPVRFGVSKHGFDNPLTPELLFAYDETLPDKHPFRDWEAACDRAFQSVVARVSARGIPAWDYLDSEQLLEACAFQAWRDAATAFGPEFRDLREELSARVDEEIDLYCTTVGVDSDRDGAVSTPEKHGRTGTGRGSRKP